MAIQPINVGVNPNDTTGDKLRDGFIKVNNNEAYLDTRINNLTTNFVGSIDLSTPTPTQTGIYVPTVSGTYTNFGGLVVDLTAGYTTITFSAPSTYAKQVVPISAANGIVKDGDVLPTSGNEVYLKALKKQDLEPITVNFLDNRVLTPDTYIDYSTGNVLALAGYNSTDFIRISASTQYIMSTAFQIAFYDEQKTYISGIAHPTTAFTTPTGTFYFRTAADSWNILKLSIVQGSTKKIYSPFIKGVKNTGVSAKNVADVDLIGLTKNISNSNLIDFSSVTRSTYIESSNGLIEPVGDSDIYSTKIIRIVGGKSYEFGSLLSQNYALYDKDLNYIIGFNNSSHSTKTFVAPHNAVYIALTGHISDIPNQYLIQKDYVDMYDESNIIRGYYVGYGDGIIVPAAGYSTTQLIAIRPSAKYSFGTVNSQQYAFYDSDGVYVSGSIGPNLSFVAPNNAYYIRFTTLIGHIPYQSFRETPTEDIINTIYLSPAMNTNNWNSIRTFVRDNTQDASYWKRYIITIPNGTWNEIDWGGWGPYVELRGQDRYKTIIVTDGTDTNPTHIIPGDYCVDGRYAGQQVATVPHDWKHLVFCYKDLNLSNMTMISTDCKYVLHLDDIRSNNINIKNCEIKYTACNNGVGIGIWGGQKIKIENSRLTNLSTGGYGILIHNVVNQSQPTEAIFKGLSIVDTGYLYINEQQSTQNDTIILENCKSNNKTVMFTSASSSDVYNIALVNINTDVTSYTQTNRPSYLTQNQL